MNSVHQVPQGVSQPFPTRGVGDLCEKAPEISGAQFSDKSVSVVVSRMAIMVPAPAISAVSVTTVIMPAVAVVAVFPVIVTRNLVLPMRVAMMTVTILVVFVAMVVLVRLVPMPAVAVMAM